MVLIKDVQTALARPPTETDTSAVVTGPVLYVNVHSLKYLIMFANIYSCEKVECKGGKWTEIQDCGGASCRGVSQGGARC